MKNFYNILLKLTLLSLLIGLYSSAGYATIYYVSNTGNDANSGLSTSLPWKSIAKVNSSAFVAGDQILFQRGSTFYGTLINSSSGAAGSPITYGAYGSGEKPIITGFTVISGWVNEGNGIYSKVISSESQTNMVTVDGVNTAMGRYPNASYLTYESCNSNYSITDNELGSTINWTGAEVVIRKNDWTLDRCMITNHSGGVLTYTNKGTGQNATANFGYFIQNNLGTLDQPGEWYHNSSTGKFYMYFGSIDPSTKTVKVATLKNVIFNMKSNGNYITLDNLCIIGSINNAINLPEWYTQFNIIQNCNVSFSGAVAIYSQSANTTINGNLITDCANMGIYINRENTQISSNRMFNIGMVEGQSLTGANNAIHLGNANNSVSEYNVLENIGYDGIFIAHGTNIKVKNNFINNVCMILNDGGGIYTGDPSTNFVIDGNIILNSVGNAKGRNGNSLLAEGIYLDEYAAGITVKNNTTVNCSNAGIKLHKGSNNIIRNNVSYNNAKGIDFFNSLSNWSMSGNYMAKNIFFAKTTTQQALNFTTMAQDGCKFGVADSNYYVRPIKDDTSIQTYEPNNNTFLRNLSSWQSYTSQDAHSGKSPQSITSESELQFEYNASQSPKVIALSTPMIDVKGTKYSGSITLQPYTSVILMRDKSVVSVAPVIYNVTGGGVYTSGGVGVAVGLSNSQIGVNYQLKLDGTNNGSVMAGTGSPINFGNKTLAGTYTVVATHVTIGSTAMMAGSAIITLNTTSSSILVTGVSVSPASASISVNGTQQLTAAILPTNATNKSVTWSSSNSAIATVNSQGLVTGVSAGNATITVRTADGGKTATCNITVGTVVSGSSYIGSNTIGSQAESGGNNFWIANSFTATSSTTVNRISLYVINASGNARLGIYTSNGTEPGTLLAQTGEIVLTNGWNSGLLNLSQNLVAGRTYWLAYELSSSATAVKYNTAYGRMKYKSITYGTLPSSAPLSCSAGSGIYSIYADNSGVAESILITGVSVSPASASISVNGTQQLTAAILPTNATNKSVTWSSSNSAIATVNSQGLVTGVSAGTATITVRTADGGKTATCNITVGTVVSGSSYIGSNTIGSQAESGGNNFWIANSFTATSSTTVNRISLYVINASGNARLGIYTSNGTEPGTLLAQTGEIVLTNGWNSGLLNLSQNLVAGRTYWLAYELSSSATAVKYNTAYGRMKYKSMTYGTLPSSAPLSCSAGSGIYSIYADNTNVIKSAEIQPITQLSKGIEDLTEIVKIDVFPNPCKSKFTVRFSSLPAIGSRIDIIDITGRKVVSRVITETSEEFDMENQPAGLYLVKSITGVNESTHKLILNK